MYQSQRRYHSGVRQSGAGFIVTAGAPPSLGRAIILDGINDYGRNTDTGTAVPSAQAAWRFMARIRGLSNPGPDQYIFRESSAATLVLRVTTGGSFGFLLVDSIGGGFSQPSPSFLTIPTANIIVLIRCNPAATEVSMELWDITGSNYAGTQTTSASSANTNFQSRDIAVGASQATGPGNFLAARIDRMLFKTGAGTFNSTVPDVLTETADIFDWTFDADNGVDATGHANLTLNGSPTFEDTP